MRLEYSPKIRWTDEAFRRRLCVKVKDCEIISSLFSCKKSVYISVKGVKLRLDMNSAKRIAETNRIFLSAIPTGTPPP